MIVRNKDGSLSFLNIESFYNEKTKYNEIWKMKYGKILYEKKDTTCKENMINYLDGKKISL